MARAGSVNGVGCINSYAAEQTGTEVVVASLQCFDAEMFDMIASILF